MRYIEATKFAAVYVVHATTASFGVAWFVRRIHELHDV